MSKTGKRDRDGYAECAQAQREAHRIAREQRIPASAWRVLSVLVDHTASYSRLGDSISQARIAELAGYEDKSSVRKALKLLKAHGIVTAEHRPGYRSVFRLAAPCATAEPVPPAAQGAASSPCATPDPHPVQLMAQTPCATSGTTYEERLTEEETYPCAPRSGYVSTTEKQVEIDSQARVDSDSTQAAGDADPPPRGESDEERRERWNASGRDWETEFAEYEATLVAENGNEDEDVELVPSTDGFAEPLVVPDTPPVAFDALGYPMPVDTDAEIEQRKRAAEHRLRRDETLRVEEEENAA